jgi:hypothetical protein
MAIVKRFRGLQYVEESSFGVGTPSVNLRCFNIEFTPDITMITPEYQKSLACVGPDSAIVAGKGGELKFSMYLRGGNGAESEFSILASNTGLTRQVGAAGSGGIASAGAGTLVADSAGAIATYVTGQGIVAETAVTPEMRWVSKKDTATLTIEPNWVSAPNNAAYSFYATDTFVPCNATVPLGEPTKYLAFYLISENDEFYTIHGCAGTWKITTTTANALPVVEWTYMVDSWTRTGSSAATSFADTFSAAHPLLGDSFFIDNTATVIRSISFDPGITVVPLEATSGTNGRSGWLYQGGGTPKLEVEMLFSATLFDYWAAGTTFQAAFTSIKSSTNGWGLYCPKVQILKGTQGEINGLVSLKPELLICDPGLSADSSPLQIPMWSLSVTGYGT